MRYRLIATALVLSGVLSGIAAVATMTTAGASSPQLTNVVSQTPVGWTPNVSGGPTVGQSTCNATYFGVATSCQSEVYNTAYVNGDVVVVGAFTEVCAPGGLSSGLCKTGTQVTRNDIFAYKASTGAIDPDFAPALNAGPAYSVIPGPAGSNTVYVGGAFTTVNGVTHKGLVQLNVNPGVTTGTTADGSVVTGFKANVSNFVHNLALSPDGKALYVGGLFTSVNSTAATGLVRVNAATGAVDPSFAFTLSGTIATGVPVKVEAMDLTSNGSLLAVSYAATQINGVSRPRVAVIATGGTLGATASLADFNAPILANNCSAEHDYVRALAIAPDGSYLVIADTGYKSDGSTPFAVCDAVARFNLSSAATGTTGTAVNVSPAWIDYSGGDSFYSATIAGNTIYTGGHNRWINNFCGTDHVCEQNALLQNGLSAFDANTGMGIAWWHPLTLRGAGTMYISTFGPGTYDGANAGLVMGTDVDVIAGAYHSENALLPAGPATTPRPAGPIPSGLFAEEGGTSTGHPLCLDDPGNSTTPGTVADLEICVNTTAQYWTVPAPGTTGPIKVNGLCLDTAGGGTTSGTGAVLDACDPTSTTQTWSQGQGNSVVNAGATTAHGSPMCLDDPSASTATGAKLDIAPCSGSASQTWPLPVAPGSPTSAPVGPVFLQATQSTSQVACLDDQNAATAAGTKVQLWTCRGDAAQTWTIEPDHTIRLGSGSNCLDTSGGATTSGTLVVLDPCSGATSQTWNPGPNNTLVQQSSGLCLSDPGGNTASGTQLDIENCPSGTSNTQAWRIDGVGGPIWNTITVTNPGNQASGTNLPASLQIQATDSGSGQTLSYSATGLPTGLAIDAATGLVSGTPTVDGTYQVTVTATDTAHFAGATSFTWVVTKTDLVTVTTPANRSTIVGRHASLQIQAASTTGATLHYSATGLPKGLSIGASTGLISGTPANSGTSTVTVTVTDTAGKTGKATFTWTVTGRIRGYRGQCVTDYNYLSTSGTKVVINPCNNLLREQWSLGPKYSLRINGMCLTDPHFGRSGTKLVLMACQGLTSQHWAHKANGEYVVASHNLCLTDPRGSVKSGTQLVAETCHAWSYQKWTRP